ncbi:MAG: GntR family transcriptional regulator [Asticcacaulis sp.]|uniref:GntR family transcriptional regulator n=1 Tax=Asticcacaulis sp. TaxID=1872648 RepID=UPI003F7BE7DB
MSFVDTVGALASDDPAPLYMQLQKILRDAIVTRLLSPEAAIPPERDLADEFGVSRLTVRKAVDGLVEEGLITRRRGAGTFVAARVEKSFSKLSSFSEDMISRGRKPHSEWLNRSQGAVTPEESLSLGLSPGSLVYRFQRLRFADGQTMALEYSTIPGYCLPSLDSVGESLYAALQAAGQRPVRALQRLRAVAFGPEQAQLLGVRVGDPGLFIERRGFLADGRAAEFTHSWYRGDAYDVVAELNG